MAYSRFRHFLQISVSRLGNFTFDDDLFRHLAKNTIFDIISNHYSLHFYSRKVELSLLELPAGMLAKFTRYAEKMETYGPDLGMPHTKPMGKGLFELRLQAQEGIARVFYCCVKNRQIIVLHHFIKKTQQTPKAHIQLARIRQQDSER
jgi:phage-related protein